MKAEFEEKDFEAPLYNELRFGSHLIATPGQVFEGCFGVDAALEAENPFFWDLFGFYDVPRGVVLDHYSWGFLWRRLEKKRRLPTFNTNLLIQSKRPQPLKRAPSIFRDHGFSSMHWRFDVKDHQQEILEKVSKKLRRRAMVIYASPAFHTLDELYNYTDTYAVVENTNFVKVEKLHNHRRWSYYQPGTSGIAHSKIEFIEDASFYSMIDAAREVEEIGGGI